MKTHRLLGPTLSGFSWSGWGLRICILTGAAVVAGLGNRLRKPPAVAEEEERDHTDGSCVAKGRPWCSREPKHFSKRKLAGQRSYVGCPLATWRGLSTKYSQPMVPDWCHKTCQLSNLSAPCGQHPLPYFRPFVAPVEYRVVASSPESWC